MDGFHEVKVFRVTWKELREGWNAPEGWKPFAVIPSTVGGSSLDVVCRKWNRREE